MKLWVRKQALYIGCVGLLLLGLANCNSGSLNSSPNLIETTNIRTADGSDNNFNNVMWGTAGSQLLRASPAAYGDGASSLGGQNRPNPRAISNALFNQTTSIPNARGLSAFVWQWGQFLDHDIDLTGGDPSKASVPIDIPQGDLFFDPRGTGQMTIPFTRSLFDPATGTDSNNPRQQLNEITPWIDASQVYGSDLNRALWLRTMEGGRLKTSTGDFMPFNDGIMPNAPDMRNDLFVGGDVRANEQAGLTAMHILFLREHNRLAAKLAAEHPLWDDELVYQQARRWVGAYMQSITYNEFLPALLGPHAPGAYTGYDSAKHPGIFNEFSTALFRLGHSMIGDQLARLDNNGQEVPEGHLTLADAFFNPTRIVQEGGIDSLLKGFASQGMQEVDTKMVNSLRNFLFGPPGSGGFDLAALNIQRGRDHGLSDYNTLRVSLGLEAYTEFSQITSNPELAQALATLYQDINTVDLWVGGLAEDHLPGASVGELTTTLLKLQFENLKNSDRFWYENDPVFTAEEIEEINNTRLSDIIKRNTAITNLQNNVFFKP